LAWDVTDFEIKAASEHTINDKRFDLELQIFHKPRATVAKDEEEGKKAGAGAKRRLQAEGEKKAEATTDVDKAK
jgi:carbonic anhydrase